MSECERVSEGYCALFESITGGVDERDGGSLVPHGRERIVQCLRQETVAGVMGVAAATA